MSEHGRGILMYETTLGPEARRRIKEIGRTDIVIGIPSYRNGRTIGEVVDAVAKGIAMYLPGRRVVLMNADGGSSDNTVRHVAEILVSANVEKLVTLYQGTTGKGTGIRAIFEVSSELSARACAVIEARAPGIVPEWIPALIDPVLRGDDIVLGLYERSAYASALCDNLIYPFLRIFFNTNLREPLAGEFCVSGDLAAELAGRDVWETNVARFGVNAWIATQVLAENRRVSQSCLGYRGDGSVDPGVPLDARFFHTVGTTFRLLTVHRRLWQSNPSPRHVRFQGKQCLDRTIPCRDCVADLVTAMHNGQQRHSRAWESILSPQVLEGVLDILEQPLEDFDFPVELWVRLAIEFAVVFNRGEGDPDKVVEALMPLFYGRAAAYVRRTQEMTLAEREVVVQGVLQAFVNAKPFFLERWDRYRPWIDGAARYWFT